MPKQERRKEIDRRRKRKRERLREKNKALRAQWEKKGREKKVVVKKNEPEPAAEDKEAPAAPAAE